MTDPQDEEPVATLEQLVDVAKTLDHVQELAEALMDLERREPIICLTSRPGDGLPALNPRDVHGLVRHHAEVWFVPTRRLAVELNGLLPPLLGVDDGEARIYWPGLRIGSDWRDHPLIMTPRGSAAALQDFEEAWHRGPQTHTRAENARRVLEEAGVEEPTVQDLCQHQYALVVHNIHHGGESVSGHDSTDEALAHAGVLFAQCWAPDSLEDLDAGETVLEEYGFEVAIDVTAPSLAL